MCIACLLVLELSINPVKGAARIIKKNILHLLHVFRRNVRYVLLKQLVYITYKYDALSTDALTAMRRLPAL